MKSFDPTVVNSLVAAGRRSLLALCGTLLLFGGCAAPAPKSGQKTPPKPVVSSIKVTKADELAAEALQLRFKKNDFVQSLKLMQKAAKSAPQRVDLQWLYFSLCAQTVDCDATSIEATLQKLDSNNSAFQLGALARALRDGDPAAERTALEAITRGRGFDIYWNSLISRLASTKLLQQSQPAQPLTRSLNQAMQWYAQLSSVTFGPIVVSCSLERTDADFAVRNRCTRIALLLTQSDTLIGETIGTEIAQRVLVGDLAAKMAERVIISRYQQDTASEIINAQLDREKLSGQLLEVMGKVPREQDVYVAIIRWGGQPELPPRE